MISLTTIEPITAPDISAVNLPGGLISLGIGVAVWLVASFVITGITKRVAAGSTLFKKSHFRWVAPAFRALDHERRVQRAETIGALLRSVVGVLIAVLTIVYVLKYLNVDVAPHPDERRDPRCGDRLRCPAVDPRLPRRHLHYLRGPVRHWRHHRDFSEVVGTVEAMGLRITRVRADDGTIWYLRNGEILRVGNRSQGTYVPPETSPAAEADSAPQQKAGE